MKAVEVSRFTVAEFKRLRDVQAATGANPFLIRNVVANWPGPIYRQNSRGRRIGHPMIPPDQFDKIVKHLAAPGPAKTRCRHWGPGLLEPNIVPADSLSALAKCREEGDIPGALAATHAKGSFAERYEILRQSLRAEKSKSKSKSPNDKFRSALNSRAKNHARRTTGEFTADDAIAILARQGGKCAKCEALAEHIDHILPVALGGSNDPANLQWLCAFHNLSKGARLAA